MSPIIEDIPRPSKNREKEEKKERKKVTASERRGGGVLEDGDRESPGKYGSPS